jgi:cell division protein FtsL
MTRWYRLAAMALILTLLVGLYRAKTDASAAQARLRALEAEITETQVNIQGLKAEIAALETPARIEALARRELKLTPGAAAPLPESEMDRLLPPAEAQN